MNVKLTFDQLQQIDAAQKRLANIQTEVSVALKVLTEKRLELEQVLKDKDYQEGLLGEVTAKVATITFTLKQLESNVLEKTDLLNHLLDTINTERVSHETKTAEFQEREIKLIAKEQELNQTTQSLAGKMSNYTEATEEFNDKVATLKAVLNTF